MPGVLIYRQVSATRTNGLWTFSSGYAARRAERLCLSGDLPLLLFLAATQPWVRYADRGIHRRSHLLCRQVINRHLISTRFQPGGPGRYGCFWNRFNGFSHWPAGGGGRETVETVGRIAWDSHHPVKTGCY